MKKEYMSPELELLDLKSPVIMDTVNETNNNVTIGGDGNASATDEFDENGY